jgi:hypothetical protein
MNKVGRPKLPNGKKKTFDKVSVRTDTKKIIVEQSKLDKIPIYLWVHLAVQKKIYDEHKKNSSN